MKDFGRMHYSIDDTDVYCSIMLNDENIFTSDIDTENIFSQL